MRRIACVLGLAALLGACMAQEPTTTASFSAEEAAFIRKSGTGVIVGHAFRTRSKGQVVNAAGEVVKLIPATAYARERFRNFYGSRKYVPHRDYPRDDNPDQVDSQASGVASRPKPNSWKFIRSGRSLRIEAG